jgi:hypothetical protein
MTLHEYVATALASRDGFLGYDRIEAIARQYKVPEADVRAAMYSSGRPTPAAPPAPDMPAPPPVVEQIPAPVVDRTPPVPTPALPPRDVRLEPQRPRGFDAVVAAFRQHGHELKSTRDGYRVRCPLASMHRRGDRRPSLHINRAPDGRTAFVYCHVCKKERTAKIVAAVGLVLADLFPDDLTAQRSRRRESLAEYPYVSMAGELVATKVRYRDTFHPKRFAWKVGDRWKLTDAERRALPLYRERDLVQCETAYIVEGEKAVDALGTIPATCAPHGAGVWEARWTDSLRLLSVQHVVILVDHDAAGAAHGELVAAALHAATIDVRVVALPGLTAGQDVVDWLALGHTISELEAIAAATPRWVPGRAERERADRRRALTYARVVNFREKQRRLARGGSDIASVTSAPADIARVTPAPPVTLKRCNAGQRTSDQPSKVLDSLVLPVPSTTDLPPDSEDPVDFEISVSIYPGVPLEEFAPEPLGEDRR